MIYQIFRRKKIILFFAYMPTLMSKKNLAIIENLSMSIIFFWKKKILGICVLNFHPVKLLFIISLIRKFYWRPTYFSLPQRTLRRLNAPIPPKIDTIFLLSFLENAAIISAYFLHAGRKIIHKCNGRRRNRGQIFSISCRNMNMFS